MELDELSKDTQLKIMILPLQNILEANSTVMGHMTPCTPESMHDYRWASSYTGPVEIFLNSMLTTKSDKALSRSFKIITVHLFLDIHG